MAIYWYVGDALKSHGSLIDNPMIPYDDVTHKEASIGQSRPDRIRRGATRSIVELSVYQALERRGRVKRRVCFVFSFVFLSVNYAIFRVLNFRRRRKKRKELTALANRIQDPLTRSAIYHVPRCYLEDAWFYYSWPARVEEAVDSRKLKNGFSVSYSSRLDHGLLTKLSQHGAFYGEINNHKGTDIEAKLPSLFFTWGWKNSENNVPFEPYALKKLRHDYENTNKRGSHVMLVMPTYYDDETLKTVKDVANGIIEESARNELKVLIRPRPSKIEKKRIKDIEYISNYFKQKFLISDDADIRKSLFSSSLVVCISHPATVFLQCMYLPHPVVALASPRVEYRNEYLPHVDKLHSCGVLYATPTKLTDHVSSVLGHIERWWEDVLTKEAIHEYRKTYCGAISSNKG